MSFIAVCNRPGMLALAALGVCVVAVPSQAIIIIDDWSTNQGPMVNFDFSGNTVTGSMLGGKRKMYLQNVTGNGTTSANVSGGMLHVSKTADAFPDVSMIWDAGVNQVGLGGVDITEGGANDRLRMVVSTNGRASVAVYISETFGKRSLGYFNFSGPTSGTFDLLFSNIPSDGGSPADFSKVGAIYFDILLDTYGPGAATEFQMGTFSVVPSPASAGLLALSGLVGLRRRRA